MSERDLPGDGVRGPLAPDENSFRNQFLIALPTLEGDYFHGSICLLADHSAGGAFGLVINKPVDIELEDLFPEKEFRIHCPVLEGGPVDSDRLFFLHESPWSFSATFQISADLCLTSSTDLIDSLVDGTGPSRLLAVLGYAGWGAGQLESEITDDVWLLSPSSGQVVFDTPFPQRPTVAGRIMGGDLHLPASCGQG